MSDAAMETVFSHFDARRRNDLDAFADGLAPDVVHQGVHSELVCNGRKEVVERFRSLGDTGTSGVDRLELIAAGDQVIVGIGGPRFRDVPFLNGEVYMVFTVRDRRIQRIDDYRTRDEATRAVRTAV